MRGNVNDDKQIVGVGQTAQVDNNILVDVHHGPVAKGHHPGIVRVMSRFGLFKLNNQIVSAIRFAHPYLTWIPF